MAEARWGCGCLVTDHAEDAQCKALLEMASMPWGHYPPIDHTHFIPSDVVASAGGGNIEAGERALAKMGRLTRPDGTGVFCDGVALNSMSHPPCAMFPADEPAELRPPPGDADKALHWVEWTPGAGFVGPVRAVWRWNTDALGNSGWIDGYGRIPDYDWLKDTRYLGPAEWKPVAVEGSGHSIEWHLRGRIAELEAENKVLRSHPLMTVDPSDHGRSAMPGWTETMLDCHDQPTDDPNKCTMRSWTYTKPAESDDIRQSSAFSTLGANYTNLERKFGQQQARIANLETEVARWKEIAAHWEGETRRLAAAPEGLPDAGHVAQVWMDGEIRHWQTKFGPCAMGRLISVINTARLTGARQALGERPFNVPAPLQLTDEAKAALAAGPDERQMVRWNERGDATPTNLGLAAALQQSQAIALAAELKEAGERRVTKNPDGTYTAVVRSPCAGFGDPDPAPPAEPEKPATAKALPKWIVR
jgi:hypothetical protein